MNLRTSLVSPQFYVVFDEEFTTVPYLSNDVVPPNWDKLVEKSTVHYIDPDVDPPNNSWLHPTPSNISASEGAGFLNSSVSGGVGDNNQAADPEMNIDTPRLSNKSSSPTIGPPASDTFVDIDSIGLRRSGRIARKPFKGSYALMMLACQTICSSTQPMIRDTIGSTIKCFQARKIAYQDYLDLNFDNTPNQISPLAQIYLSSKANNEVYNLKEMLQQPDRDDFIKAMEKEVASMFEEGIWEKVPKSVMLDYYRKERNKGLDIRRHQIMMIWSFKRKQHLDGQLNKYKA